MTISEIVKQARTMMVELDKAYWGIETLSEEREEEILSFYETHSQSIDFLIEDTMIQLLEYIQYYESKMTKLESQGLF